MKLHKIYDCYIFCEIFERFLLNLNIFKLSSEETWVRDYEMCIQIVILSRVDTPLFNDREGNSDACDGLLYMFFL